MKIELHPDAEQEFIEASQYYEVRASGLGEAFISELEYLKNLLSHYPELGSSTADNLRRLTFPRFPYSLIYAVES